MASPGQRRGVCGHAMAGFDQHAHCARCRDKKKGSDPCVKGNICPSCNILTEEQKLRLATPVEKSELEPKQVFEFVGYQFDLQSGRVRPTPDRWRALQGKIQTLLSLPACPVRQFMSLIGLLTATEKQVHLGRLHMRPIQWHLKNNWRVPESVEKVIPLPRSLHPRTQFPVLYLYNDGTQFTGYFGSRHC